MCNLYSITRGQEAMRHLFRVTRDLSGNLPALPAVYPDTMAPVVRVARDGVRELTMMRWGLRRRQTAATSFCEWGDSRPKVTHWFALDESRPLFAFAGIWRLWTGERKGETGRHELFSFLTTEAYEAVRPVHAKAMPVLLTAAGDWDTCLPGRLTKLWRCKGRCRMQCCASWLPAIRRTVQSRRNCSAYARKSHREMPASRHKRPVVEGPASGARPPPPPN
jgi:putative SOS response-associated peptidase YedK